MIFPGILATSAAVVVAAVTFSLGASSTVCNADDAGSIVESWGGATARDFERYQNSSTCNIESIHVDDIKDWNAFFDKYLGDETRLSVAPIIIDGDMEDWPARGAVDEGELSWQVEAQADRRNGRVFYSSFAHRIFI